MNKQLESLMQREMSRKEFLATMGLAVASILGFSSLIKLLGLKNHSKHESGGYGSRVYGR